MDFQSALEYLYRFVNFEAKPAEVYAPENFDLSRVTSLLKRLNNPHECYESVHIAGTKGKGSVAAMVESILRSAGHKTGLFTSPHLQNFSERIQIDREMIPRTALANLVAELRPHIDATHKITFYEISTVLALEWFARQEVAIAVIEVGLGGRLDATNVISPTVCAITPISFDHTEILGEKVESIAAEKAGIIKRGVPVVLAPQPSPAKEVLKEKANTVGAPLIDTSTDWEWCSNIRSTSGQQCTIWRTENSQEKNTYQLPLLGNHQIENATVALALVEQLREQGWFIPQDAIAQGIKTVRWPARCQVLPGQPPVILDCAHNQESANRLAATLQEYFPNMTPVLVFGTMRDKDLSGMLAELLPDCKLVIMTSMDSPRALPPHELIKAADRHDCPTLSAIDISSALVQGKRAASPNDIVVVTGSVAIAGAAHAVLTKGTHGPL